MKKVVGYYSYTSSSYTKTTTTKTYYKPPTYKKVYVPPKYKEVKTNKKTTTNRSTYTKVYVAPPPPKKILGEHCSSDRTCKSGCCAYNFKLDPAYNMSIWTVSHHANGTLKNFTGSTAYYYYYQPQKYGIDTVYNTEICQSNASMCYVEPCTTPECLEAQKSAGIIVAVIILMGCGLVGLFCCMKPK